MFSKVEGVLYVNDHLEKLMFDELQQFSSAGGIFYILISQFSFYLQLLLLLPMNSSEVSHITLWKLPHQLLLMFYIEEARIHYPQPLIT